MSYFIFKDYFYVLWVDLESKFFNVKYVFLLFVVWWYLILDKVVCNFIINGGFLVEVLYSV